MLIWLRYLTRRWRSWMDMPLEDGARQTIDIFRNAISAGKIDVNRILS